MHPLLADPWIAAQVESAVAPYVGRLSDAFGIGVLPAVVIGVGAGLLALVLALRAPAAPVTRATPAPR